MLLLMGYVVPNGGGSRLTYRERPVAGLPRKKMVFGPALMYPSRRVRFYQTSDVGDGAIGGDANQQMDVIASSIDAESGASNLTDDASEEACRSFSNSGLMRAGSDPSPHEQDLRPEGAIQRSVLDGFGDVFWFDCGGAFQVGDGAGHF